MFYVFGVTYRGADRAVIHPSRNVGNAHIRLLGKFKSYAVAVACARNVQSRSTVTPLDRAVSPAGRAS